MLSEYSFQMNLLIMWIFYVKIKSMWRTLARVIEMVQKFDVNFKKSEMWNTTTFQPFFLINCIRLTKTPVLLLFKQSFLLIIYYGILHFLPQYNFWVNVSNLFYFQDVFRHDPVQDLLYRGGVRGRTDLYHHCGQVSRRHGNCHRPQPGPHQPMELRQLAHLWGR